MKIRTGFVSNSSSSSFMIVSKNGKLTKELLMKVFKVQKGDLFYPIAKDLAEFIVDNVEETTTKEILVNFCADDISELPDEVKKCVKSESGTIYEGSAADDGDSSVEHLLVDLDIHYEDDDIIFEKEGGY